MDILKKIFGFSFGISVVGFVVLLLFTALLASYLVRLNPELFGLLKGPEILEQEEDKLIAEVESIIELPQDEEPTVATVTDPAQLEGQNFFKNAQVGDRILVYNGARKAVLYRPSERRVVEVGNVNIADGGDNPSNEEQGPPRFALFNGTSVNGLTTVVENNIKANLEEFEVVFKENASVTTYTSSVLVDVSGRGDAEDVGESLGIAVGELPEGETAPEDIDYLIIVGTDQVVLPDTSEEETEASEE